MRDLDDSLLLNLLKHDLSIPSVLSFSRMGVGHIECRTAYAPNVSLVDASHNNLKFLDFIWWKICPSAWWIDASFNQITEFSMDMLPRALGSLNLASNSIYPEKLHVLRSTYILRLTLVGNNSEASSSFLPANIGASEYRSWVINLLSNIWVLDDRFITHSERLLSAKFALSVGYEENDGVPQSPGVLISQQWGTREPSEREVSIMRLVQSIPLDGLSSDFCRLDVLLEDYLEESRLVAEFNRSHLSNGKTKILSFSINMLQLLSLPHRVRMDLSVLLTVAVLFTLPKLLFKDTLVLLLGPHIPLNDLLCYSSLPAFINTAVVSVIRRICRRELQELSAMHLIPPKPGVKEFPRHTTEYLSGSCFSSQSEDTAPATYIGTTGFNHLQPFKAYLHRTIFDRNYPPSATTEPSELSFSELELEILNTLPDAPSRAAPSPLENGDAYWIGFAARHAVLLLSAVPNFPALTTSLRNKVDQSLYDQLSPLLSAAKMGHEDLELDLTGPDVDGRTAGEKALKFGSGLPRGKPCELYWRKNSRDIKSMSRRTSDAVSDVGTRSSSISLQIKPPSFDLESHSVQEEGLCPLSDESSKRGEGAEDALQSRSSQGIGSKTVPPLDDAISDLEDNSMAPESARLQDQSTADQPYVIPPTGPRASLSAPTGPRPQGHRDESDTEGQGKGRRGSEKADFNGSRVSGFSNDSAWKASFMLAPVPVSGPVTGPSHGGLDTISPDRRKLAEKQGFWEEIGRPPIVPGAGMPELLSRLQLGLAATPSRNTRPTARLGAPQYIRDRLGPGEGGVDQMDGNIAAGRQLLQEMGTLRNIRQLNDSISSKFGSSEKSKGPGRGKGRKAFDKDKEAVSKSSDCVSMSALILKAASSSSYLDLRTASKIQEGKRECEGGQGQAKDPPMERQRRSRDTEDESRLDKDVAPSYTDSTDYMDSLSDVALLAEKVPLGMFQAPSDKTFRPAESSASPSKSVWYPQYGKVMCITADNFNMGQPITLKAAPIQAPSSSQSQKGKGSEQMGGDPEGPLRPDSVSLPQRFRIRTLTPCGLRTVHHTPSPLHLLTMGVGVCGGGSVEKEEESVPSQGSESSLNPGGFAMTKNKEIQKIRHQATHKLVSTHTYRSMYRSQKARGNEIKVNTGDLGIAVNVNNYNTSVPKRPKDLPGR